MRIMLVVFAMALSLSGSPVHGQTPDLYDMTMVRSLYLTFKQVDWWQQLTNNYSTKTDIKADLTVDGKPYPDIGVRFKGNSSYRSIGSSQKKSFNLSTDSFVPSQRLYGYKTLNLNNAFLDPTFVREVVSYEIFRRFMPAPKANFVKLYINNQYWGVYVNVQQANTEFLDEAFGEDGGNNFKGEGNTTSSSSLQWLGSNPTSYKNSYELKSGDEQTAWNNLVTMIDKLNNTSTQQLPQVLPGVLDVDRALWFIALNNVLCNLDSYIGRGQNYFTYQDEAANVFNMVPWDLNEAFGVFSEGKSIQQLQQLSPTYQDTNYSGRPLVAKLLGVSTWREQYLAHIRTLLKESFSWAAVSPLVTKYQNLIRQDVLADTKKLYSSTYFSQNVTQDLRLSGGGPGGRWVPGLKPFIEARAAYLNSHYNINKTVPVISQVSHLPASPTETETVWIKVTIKAAAGISLSEVVYSGGVSTLYDDGKHNDGVANDGIYGGSIPPVGVGATVRYYIRATANGGGMALDPARAGFVTYSYSVQPKSGTSPVQIHEFVAKNDTGIKDEKNEFEDWIELTNTGTTAFTLTGCYLTDKLDNPTKWAFPTGFILQPGQTLVVWADEDQNDGPLHTNFKLSAGGESIHFFDKDGKTRLDTVTFGAQQADVSTGRMVGSPSTWVTFPSPTPRALNLPAPGSHLAYDGLDITKTQLTLTGLGTPAIGGTASFKIENAPASSIGVLGLALMPFSLKQGSLGSLLVHPWAMAVFNVYTNSTGTATPSLPIPNVSALKGMNFYIQTFVYNGVSGGFSNGVITRIHQ